MDVHKNARLTLACRVLLVERILAGRAQLQVAREVGVSERTARKWLSRYRQEGAEGLKDRSSRPRHCPSATPEVLRRAILALRRERLTLVNIAAQLQLSRSTIARIAKAGGLSRLSEFLKRHTGQSATTLKVPVDSKELIPHSIFAHQGQNALLDFIHGLETARPDMSRAAGVIDLAAASNFGYIPVTIHEHGIVVDAMRPCRRMQRELVEQTVKRAPGRKSELATNWENCRRPIEGL